MLYVSISRYVNRYVKHVNSNSMYYDHDLFDAFPDLRDPVTGDWLPLSESDKARQVRSERQRLMSNSQITSMLSSIFK